MHEKSFIDGWAKFTVYGHTHHYEIVPLQSLRQGDSITNQICINSGTWRPVHELARFHPGFKRGVAGTCKDCRDRGGDGPSREAALIAA
jgi:hypothetical protein